jgi:hypothetical protein
MVGPVIEEEARVICGRKRMMIAQVLGGLDETRMDHDV